MGSTTEMLKGILEGCILEIISRGETYGYEIPKELEKNGFSSIGNSTIYTILTRLERSQLIKAEKLPSKFGPLRKAFSLTKTGDEKRSQFWTKWNQMSSKVNKLRRVN